MRCRHRKKVAFHVRDFPLFYKGKVHHLRVPPLEDSCVWWCPGCGAIKWPYNTRWMYTTPEGGELSDARAHLDKAGSK